MKKNKMKRWGDKNAKMARAFMAYGSTREELASHFGILVSELQKRMEESKSLKMAIEISEQKNEANDMKVLKSLMKSKEVNAPLIKLYYAARYGITDKPSDKDGLHEHAAPTLNIFTSDE